jgi:hypothetical protein
MAKAKKSDGAGVGGTKKQAAETKKAAPPRTTKAAASTPRASAEKASAGGATRKKAQAKPGAGGSSPGSVPLIDTSLAAEAAAKFVVNRALLGNAAAATPAAAQPADESQGDEKEEKRESSTFKQLKAGLNKPASQGLGGILGTTNQGKRGNTGFGGGNQQIGRNQTFGADVNRSGVPRRTGG